MKKKTFARGIHPPEHKNPTENLPLEPLLPPGKVVIPLLQHFGAPAESLVKKGDTVCLGQKIGDCPALFSACIHSSVSGKVLSVDGFAHLQPPYVDPAGSDVDLGQHLPLDGQDNPRLHGIVRVHVDALRNSVPVGPGSEGDVEGALLPGRESQPPCC